MITKYYSKYYTQNLLSNQSSGHYFQTTQKFVINTEAMKKLKIHLEEDLGKLLVISRNNQSSILPPNLPTISFLLLQAAVIHINENFKLKNQTPKITITQSLFPFSGSQKVFTHFLSDFWISYLTAMRERPAPQSGNPTKQTFILDAYQFFCLLEEYTRHLGQNSQTMFCLFLEEKVKLFQIPWARHGAIAPSVSSQLSTEAVSKETFLSHMRHELYSALLCD